MREILIEKIGNHLDNGINTEVDCVYLLAQIRKYIEQQNLNGFWNLRMCANWALHSKLDNERNLTVRSFLKEVNDFLIDAERQGGYDLKRHPALTEKLKFITALQSELKTFLGSIGISTNVCDDSEKSDKLLNAFGKVIEDTPLVCVASMSHFSEITFSKRKSITSDLWPASLGWTIKKLNNTTVHIKINKRTFQMGQLMVDVENFICIERTTDKRH